jgi:hypothetical protein
MASGKPQTSPTPQSELPSKIPQILFEGDDLSKPNESQFMQKFEFGATHKTGPPRQEGAKLPEAYGTGKLLLAARDPHTLFAHWDLTNEQQRRYNALSENGRLALRAYAHAFSNQPAVELHLEPESRHVFVHVKSAGASYVGELGYYQPGHHWKTIATSGPTMVPADAPSEDRTVTLATLPQPRQTVRKVVASGPLGTEKAAPPDFPSIIPVPVPRWPFGPEGDDEGQSARVEAARQQSPGLLADAPPFVKRKRREEWTPAQERLLAEMIRISTERREWISSAEIVELVHHEIKLPVHFAPSEIEWPFLPGALVNISSPRGEARPERKGFWFNINAELIIYGATEPNAQVTVGGRPIKLRPDGTFSCHFALPDGDYDITAVALSPENDTRQATMNFHRHTGYSCDVGAHAQNPLLERIPQPQ